MAGRLRNSKHLCNLRNRVFFLDPGHKQLMIGKTTSFAEGQLF